MATNRRSTRREFLATAGAAITAGSAGCAGGRSRDDSRSATVAILAAGSLQHALSTGLEPAVDVPVTIETHGSATVARLIAAGQRDPDVVALADVALFEAPLSPAWYAEFASNALVIAANPDTAGGKRLLDAGPEHAEQDCLPVDGEQAPALDVRDVRPVERPGVHARERLGVGQDLRVAAHDDDPNAVLGEPSEHVPNHLGEQFDGGGTEDDAVVGLVEQLDDPVFIIDTGRTVVDLNPAGESLLETSPTDAIGRDITGLLPALEGALDTDPVDEITLDSHGVRRHYDVSVSELDRAHGTVTGRIVSLRDVTERTQREQRLDVMNRLFRHNLRNEMNVVRGNAELLGTHTDDADQRERADRIIATVDEVIARSDKVGTLSRSLDDDPNRTLDLGSILDPVVESTRRDDPEATISLDAPDSCRVAGDPSVEIAIRELLENAIEHADGVTVSVTLTAIDEQRVELRIRDDGPGIPEQELQVLDSRTETPMEHASGFGLWLVTWIVERAGGAIEFDVDETGTTAIVRLPRPE